MGERAWNLRSVSKVRRGLSCSVWACHCKLVVDILGLQASVLAFNSIARTDLISILLSCSWLP